MKPCSLIGGYHYIRETYCLLFQSVNTFLQNGDNHLQRQHGITTQTNTINIFTLKKTSNLRYLACSGSKFSENSIVKYIKNLTMKVLKLASQSNLWMYLVFSFSFQTFQLSHLIFSYLSVIVTVCFL